MGLFIVLLLLVNANFLENPATTLTTSSFTDIGNGLSTRIVDIYAIAPENGTISSGFEIPDDIAGRSYCVEIGDLTGGDPSTRDPGIFGDFIATQIAISGIGSPKRNTTGSGKNRIRYDSRGF
ncbi:MAG: hypothetical protein METHP_00726 [Methanoregula sp. SKADARSKE-2]|nr:MAG: hypothetical protein METHP_00726 [Methanoregula sp. SKADARSKE-2]